MQYSRVVVQLLVLPAVCDMWYDVKRCVRWWIYSLILRQNRRVMVSLWWQSDDNKKSWDHWYGYWYCMPAMSQWTRWTRHSNRSRSLRRKAQNSRYCTVRLLIQRTPSSRSTPHRRLVGLIAKFLFAYVTSILSEAMLTKALRRLSSDRWSSRTLSERSLFCCVLFWHTVFIFLACLPLCHCALPCHALRWGCRTKTNWHRLEVLTNCTRRFEPYRYQREES